MPRGIQYWPSSPQQNLETLWFEAHSKLQTFKYLLTFPTHPLLSLT